MSSHTRKARPEFKTLRAWRDERGFTLQQAADYLNLPLTTYFNLERGNRRASRDRIKDLLAKTGVALEFLAGVA